MSAIGRFLLRAVTGVGLSAITLVIEVLLAFSLYMYLAIQQPALFGNLVRWAGGVLNWGADQLVTQYPEFSTQAYATLLGELGPKSTLLLFIGLFASGVIRLIRWIFVGLMNRSGLGGRAGL